MGLTSAQTGLDQFLMHITKRNRMADYVTSDSEL